MTLQMSEVVSLYDFTGTSLIPWASAGHHCYAYDIQHTGEVRRYAGGGRVNLLPADLHTSSVLAEIVARHSGSAVFLSAYPVCTDLAVSGARHFASKREIDPEFQRKAAMWAVWCAEAGHRLGCPWYLENPVSVLSTLWRKPDYTFHPYEYGGYLPADDIHPRWPRYISARDAYSKKTCLWTGGGFKMPPPRPVSCNSFGQSAQWGKLGGRSLKTKNIRSETPRGFAEAVYKINS